MQFILICIVFDSESYSQIILGEEKSRNSKVRRRTTQPQELLYGTHAPENMKADDQNQNHNHPLTRVPSAPGSLK
jgi:kinesin family protein 4/21/27